MLAVCETAEAGARRYSAKKASLTSLCKTCPHSESFWSVFFRIWTEYGQMLRVTREIQENTRETPNTNTFHAVSSFNHVGNCKWYCRLFFVEVQGCRPC